MAPENGSTRVTAGLVTARRLVHNGRVKRSDPCRRHDCHRCCVDTEMTLTEGDVAELEAAGFSAFSRTRSDGDLELVNHHGRCVFLVDGQCRAYEARPEGCRLYPLVLDLGWDRVVRDELCPHGREFPITGGRSDRLRRSVAREGIEAEERLRRSGG